MENISKFLEQLKIDFTISELTKYPLLVVDILIVFLIFYWIYRLLKNTKAVRILYGVLILAVIMYISSLLHLVLLHWFLQVFLTVIIIAIPVVFQPELRNALEKIGRTGLKPGVFKESKASKFLNPILDAVKIMSREKIGGIIAIQKKTGLRDYLKTGVILDADISKELLIACFVHNSPFHDGAVIIANGRILAASVVLPLSDSDSTIHLGTRHKAAVGLSEQTDAVSIVVSEKTGEISITMGGNISKNISYNDLNKFLKKTFKDFDKQGVKLIDHFHIEH